ncbi:MAG: phosphatase PAP2 family protein [Sulfuricurvum sp.]|jgi:membrane-associated phospholipid phosphatase
MTYKKSLLTLLIALATIAFSYFYLDLSAAQWAHDHLTHPQKEIFILITKFGDSTFYLIGFAVAAFFFRFYWKRPTWENRSLFLFAAVAVSGILADIVKVIAGRYRPSEFFEHGLYGFDFFHLERAFTSFPSGHTATAFSLAFALSYIWPRLSPMVWIFAAIVGVSRIAIGAHYPSDVLGGALTGILSLYLILHYWKKNPKLAL